MIVCTAHLGTLGPVLNEGIQAVDMLLKVVLADHKTRETRNIYLNARHNSAIIGIRIHLEDAVELVKVTVELVNGKSVVRIVPWIGEYLHNNINRTIIIVVCNEGIIVLLAGVGLLEAHNHSIGHFL
jgi:hypothetical protein